METETLFNEVENKAAITNNSELMKAFFQMYGKETGKTYVEFLNRMLAGFMQSSDFKELSEVPENLNEFMFKFSGLVQMVMSIENPVDLKAVCNN